MAVRSSQATWRGDLKGGSGNMRLGSGLYDGPFTWSSRFENGAGTNPEELLGAAHAGCFSMALANGLSKDGFKVNSIETTASVYLEKTDAGNSITHIELTTKGSVEGVDEAKFKEYAENTKKTCIVSRALSAVPMTVSASLV